MENQKTWPSDQSLKQKTFCWPLKDQPMWWLSLFIFLSKTRFVWRAMVSVHLFSLVLFCLFVFTETYLAGVLCYLSLCCLAGKSDLEAESATLTIFPTVLPAAWRGEWWWSPFLEEVRVNQGLGLLPLGPKIGTLNGCFCPSRLNQCHLNW